MKEQIEKFFQDNEYPIDRFIVADPKTAEITKDIPGNVNMVIEIEKPESEKYFGEPGWVIISKKWAKRSGILAMVETKQDEKLEFPDPEPKQELPKVTAEDAFEPAVASAPPPPPLEPEALSDDLPFIDDEEDDVPTKSATIAEIAKESPNVEIVKPKPVEFKADDKPKPPTEEEVKKREEHLIQWGFEKNPSSYSFKKSTDDGPMLVPYSAYAHMNTDSYNLILKKFGIIDPPVEATKEEQPKKEQEKEKPVEEIKVVDEKVVDPDPVKDEEIDYYEKLKAEWALKQERETELEERGFKYRKTKSDWVLKDGRKILHKVANNQNQLQKMSDEEWLKLTEKFPQRKVKSKEEPKAEKPKKEEKKADPVKPLTNIVTAPGTVVKSIEFAKQLQYLAEDFMTVNYKLAQVKAILSDGKSDAKTIEELKLYLDEND